jgi:hypothetical protein
MNLLKLLGLSKKSSNNAYSYENILHLWEDDYLMIELLPNENLEFVKAETTRISNFGEEHFDGAGFTDITPIGEKPVKTIERLIGISEIETVLTTAGLEKISQFHMEGVGLLQGDTAPIGFGTNKFAIMCDRQGTLLKNIYLTGHTTTEKERETLVAALLSLGRTFNFIAVNWYKDEYYNLIEEVNVAEFVKSSCWY